MIKSLSARFLCSCLCLILWWYASSKRSTFLQSNETQSKGSSIICYLKWFLNESNIERKNCIGMCTDSAKENSGRLQCTQAFVKQVSTGCVESLHYSQRNFQRNGIWSEYDLTTFVTVVSNIRIKVLISILSTLCIEESKNDRKLSIWFIFAEIELFGRNIWIFTKLEFLTPRSKHTYVGYEW